MKVLVCGGRRFNNRAFVWSRLDRLHADTPITALIQGGAQGVDALAREWVKTKAGIQSYVCKADWGQHGWAAGPIRNARMLEWKPDLVIAFPGGRGTIDMIAKAKQAGVAVTEPAMDGDLPPNN